MSRWLIVALAALSILQLQPVHAADDALAWEPAASINKPWTRWWWLGSAVDKQNLTDLLEKYSKAGMGGVEICPIYGVNGNETHDIQYLSPQWLDMLSHTTAEAKRLNMGVDMTTGTGWPMGGPEITEKDTSDNIETATFPVEAGKQFEGALPNGTLSALWAYSESGQKIDLTSKVTNGKVDWTAPDGKWTLYVVSYRPANMAVKRAAPGGEGLIIDPFSIHSLDLFLDVHSKAFADYKGILPAAQFHDSYEYQGNYTPDLFKEFKARRGYDLGDQLPALFGQGDAQTHARVLCDYRTTMAELHTEVVEQWEKWCLNHHMKSREQAHGAPANLLDLYATADIPETESFGQINDTDIPLNKFSSSAAHVTGKTLSSSESFTWLTDHFEASLAQVKQAADYLLLSGSNHIFFHGMPYSPKDAPWPGWLFYAAVNFNPNGGLWHDLPAFNGYVQRCQAILQSGHPSDDVLLYFPVYDYWQTEGGGRGRGGGNVSLVGMAIGGQWMMGSACYQTAEQLWSNGYGFDMISDAQLQNVKWENGTLTTGGNIFHAIVIPKTTAMPVETLRKLKELAAAGAPVLVQDALPSTVPGLNDLANRQKSLDDLKANNAGLAVGSDMLKLLADAKIPQETMAEKGIRFIRRTRDGGYNYFIANRGTTPVSDWITIGVPAQSAAFMDAMFPDRVGVAATRQQDGKAQVFIQLEPGESRILRTFTTDKITGAAWPYSTSAGDPVAISGTWDVKFIDATGGGKLPADYKTDSLASWTTRDDADDKKFAGTASYTITFNRPAGDAADWVLDLGKVGESADVKINGQTAGVLFSAPFKMHVGSLLKPGQNTLEIDVTNLAINRIIDMDKNHAEWKIFKNANVASHSQQTSSQNGVFDASRLPLRDSGLMGPVTLTPEKAPGM